MAGNIGVRSPIHRGADFCLPNTNTTNVVFCAPDSSATLSPLKAATQDVTALPEIVMYSTQVCLIDTRDRSQPAEETNVFKPARATPASRLAASLDYMQTHLREPIRISTLCALAGLSPSRFFELFKSAMGDTPLNWMIRARMERAGRLLAETNLQIKEVAWRVGYEDPFYFSRLFKAVHGVSPSHFRKRSSPETCAEPERKAI